MIMYDPITRQDLFDGNRSGKSKVGAVGPVKMYKQVDCNCTISRWFAMSNDPVKVRALATLHVPVGEEILRPQYNSNKASKRVRASKATVKKIDPYYDTSLRVFINNPQDYVDCKCYSNDDNIYPSSIHRPTVDALPLKYRVYKTIRARSFEENLAKEYGAGINGYLTKDDAKKKP